MKQLDDLREVSFVLWRYESVADQKVDYDRARCRFEFGRKDAFDAVGDREQLESLNLQRKSSESVLTTDSHFNSPRRRR